MILILDGLFRETEEARLTPVQRTELELLREYDAQLRQLQQLQNGGEYHVAYLEGRDIYLDSILPRAPPSNAAEPNHQYQPITTASAILTPWGALPLNQIALRADNVYARRERVVLRGASLRGVAVLDDVAYPIQLEVCNGNGA